MAPSTPSSKAVHVWPSKPSPPPKDLASTIFVNNIHCASCVAHIHDALFSLAPRPYAVDSDIVTHKVSVKHSHQLTLTSITRQLHGAGFELHSAVTEDFKGHKIAEVDLQGDIFEGWLDSAADRLSNSRLGSPTLGQRPAARRSISADLKNWEKRRHHIENCISCQAQRHDLSEKSSRFKKSFYPKDKEWKHKRQDSKKELLGPWTIQDEDLDKNTANPQEVIPLRSIREKPSVVLSKVNVPPSSSIKEEGDDLFSAELSIVGMTCSSCTNAVMDATKEFPFVRTIQVSLLTNSATIIYASPQDRLLKIQDRIKSLGYGCTVQEVVPANPMVPDARPRGEAKQIQFETVLAINGMTCASCTSAVSESLLQPPWTISANVNLLTNSATVVFEGSKEKAEELRGMVADLGFDCSVQECTPQISQSSTLVAVDEPFTVQLAIGGMTCASCTSAVTVGLEGLDYVKSVTVNLLTNSATVGFRGADNVDRIVERVEDLGFECAIDKVDQQFSSHATTQRPERTIGLQIDGMFCQHCPPQVINAIKSIDGSSVEIEQSPTLNKPVVTIRYIPNPPYFSVRNIVDAITAANGAFSVSVHHPPTIEDRSRAMQQHERRRLLLRLFLCLIVAIPTLVIGVIWMSLVPPSNRMRMFFEQPMWAGKAIRFDWALLFLATPVYFFAADVFHSRAIKEIKALWRPGSKVPILRRFYRFGSMNLLLSAGTSVAYCSSVALLISQAVRRNDGHHGTVPTYFDSVVFLTLFILAGRYLEAYSKAKTGDAVSSLGKLRPAETLLVDRKASLSTGELSKTSSQETLIRKIEADFLESGDVVRIPNGASPPSDGTVITGETTFDESSLTGEARLVSKKEGDELFAGTVNRGNPVDMQITGLTGNSMLDQIVRVVREGQTKRAPVERVADLITGYFVPVITAIAILDFVIWLSLGLTGTLPARFLNDAPGGWAFWSLQFAIAVFVVACPCGIGLAAPTALFVGSGLAAKHGILVKGGGEAFQEASSLDAIVFDKTGTLTEGSNPTVTGHELFVTHDSAKEKITWALATALEESSSHPIATALQAFCASKPRASILSSTIEELPGRGLKGTFTITHPTKNITQTYEAAIGSEKLTDSLSVHRTIFTNALLTRWASSGASLALLAVRRVDPSLPVSEQPPFTLAAAFATSTPLRSSAAPTISGLQRSGLAVYMVTGDNAATAHSLGAQLGIPQSHIRAEVLPTEKADTIRSLQKHAPKRNHRTAPTTGKAALKHRAIIAMVGDGINDAPALAAADVSVSIGTGTGIAISASKFVLVAADLSAILTLTDLSRTVFRRVKINFAWALVYNVVLVPIAAGVLMGVGERGVRLSPVWASLAMALSSVSVVASSLALRLRVPGVGWRAKKV
ncbi:MAG: hypothetical protein M1814_006768 [Vezdaea aestivalis]|nr:MAG: hypothetical protein M1814_006768 [Vezdaea aestivalis]